MQHNKTLQSIKLRRGINGHWHGWIWRIPVVFIKQKGRNGRNVLWWHARPRSGPLMNGHEEKRFQTLGSSILYLKETLVSTLYDTERSGISGKHLPVYPTEQELLEEKE